MKISILTLFPQMFSGCFEYSIIKRAVDKKLLKIDFVDIRDFGLGPHKMVDDRPYGGGVGMIMRVDVIDKALQSLRHPRHSGLSRITSNHPTDSGVSASWRFPRMTKERIVLLDPKGKTFNQAMARKYAKLDHLILICGHYEGVDERVKKLVDEVVSIGDYILTGGEIPAMVITDSVARLIPGVLSKPEAIKNESFSHLTSHISHLTLEYPQYTRPEKYQNMAVPKILLSGNHKEIDEWRHRHTSPSHLPGVLA